MAANDIHAGHRSSVRNKFIKNKGFPPGTPSHEILEMLLFYVIPRRDTNVIAHMLIRRFGSLKGVFGASIDDLMTVDGIGENAAVFIKMIPAIFKEYSKEIYFEASKKEDTAGNIGDYLLTQYAGVEDEMLSIVSMDNKGKILSHDIISRGDAHTVGISTRKILETVMKTGASTVTLAHNHPGGVALPSDEDIAATVAVKNILSSIDVKLVDHIMLVDGDYTSMAVSARFANIFRD